jgi:hypothetical protein
MIRQDLDIAGYWDVIVFYDVDTPGINQGFTYTDMKRKKSVMVIGKTSSLA